MENIERYLKNNINYLDYYVYLLKKYISINDFVNYHKSNILNNNQIYENELSLLSYKNLKWDSEIFGFPVARIDYLLSESENRIEAKISKLELLKKIVELHKDTYIICRVNTSDISSISALECSGFNLVDIRLSSYRTVNDYEYFQHYKHNNIIFREAIVDDIEEISKISYKAFLYDRFHNDFRIDIDIANKVYKAWSENSVLKKTADNVLLAICEGKIIAFIDFKINIISSFNLKIGDYGLGATIPEFQGKGLFEELLKQSLKWFKKHGVDFVQMSTQASNIPSAKTFLNRLGFILKNTTITYRKYPEVINK